jgi:SLOG cluster2
MTDALLDPNVLRDVRVGVSVSESSDLGRLGLVETHFRLALGEIARVLLLGGGLLAYGGHLRPEGYTPFLVHEIDRWNRRDQPLLVCLAWSVHRGTALSDLERFAGELRLLATMVYLDPDGAEVDPAAGRDEAPVPVEDPGEQRRALTGMRRYLRRHTSARVFLGGKRSGFQGEIPGLMEEALLAVEAKQPIYLAGGFGGVTADIISALGVDDGGWLPPDASAGPPDPRWEDGYARLAAHAAQPHWRGLANGLADDENRRLAATHRPSDIAALVSLGLGRLRRDAAPG